MIQNRSNMSPEENIDWMLKYYIEDFQENYLRCKYCLKKYKMLRKKSYFYRNHIRERHTNYFYLNVNRNWKRNFFTPVDNRVQCIICRNLYNVPEYLNPLLEIHLQVHNIHKHTENEQKQWLEQYFDINGPQCKICNNIFRKSPRVYYIRHLLKIHGIIPSFNFVVE